MPTEPHTFADLSSDKALVCWREINGEQGGATVYCVLAADGFLFECGSGGLAEARARTLADLINRGGADRLSRKALFKGGTDEG